MFDEALVKECYKREQSVIPQQALAMSNSKLVLEAAPKIASRFETVFGKVSDGEFIDNAFTTITGIEPSKHEVEACLVALRQWRELPDGTPEAARTHLIWALLNHNDFVTLR